MRFRAHAATPFLQCLGAALLLLVFAASDGRSADFIDAAGRRVVAPDRVGRVMAADRSAEVLILVLAPNKLGAWPRAQTRRSAATLRPSAGDPMAAGRQSRQHG